ncbi:MAG: restriction endonuclease subunit S [Candidatus Heimdallarchaeaceae archaeon]
MKTLDNYISEDSNKYMIPYRKIRLGSNFLSGYGFKSENFTDVGVPIIKIANIKNKQVTSDKLQFYPEELIDEKLEKYLLKDKDILIAMTGQGSVGRAGQIRINDNEKFLMNQRVGKFITEEEILLNEFLYLVISSDFYEKVLFDLASGSGQPNLSPNIILDVEIPFPNIEMQQVIAESLYTLQERIEINQKINLSLESLARVLFHSWFVAFDPFQEEEFVESELGPIPKGWKINKFTQSYLVGGGGTPKTAIEEYWDGEILWASGRDISQNNNIFLIQTERNITKLGLEKSSAKLYPKNTTIITARGTVGQTAILAKEIAISQTCYALSPIKKKFHFYMYLLVQNMIDTLKKRSYGAIFDTITTRIFDEFLIIVPEESALLVFNEIIEPIFSQILDNQKQNECLIQIRDLLLPQLLSGKLRINDPEQLLEELEQFS